MFLVPSYYDSFLLPCTWRIYNAYESPCSLMDVEHSPLIFMFFMSCHLKKIRSLTQMWFHVKMLTSKGKNQETRLELYACWHGLSLNAIDIIICNEKCIFISFLSIVGHRMSLIRSHGNCHCVIIAKICIRRLNALKKNNRKSFFSAVWRFVSYADY